MVKRKSNFFRICETLEKNKHPRGAPTRNLVFEKQCKKPWFFMKTQNFANFERLYSSNLVFPDVFEFMWKCAVSLWNHVSVHQSESFFWRCPHNGSFTSWFPPKIKRFLKQKRFGKVPSLLSLFHKTPLILGI